MESVAEKLKELIDENGPKYLTEEPYKVYKELLRSGVTDRKIAGALLMLFASGIPDLVRPEDDPSFLSKLIQRDCCLNKKMADILADIVLLLHSRENEEEWKNKVKKNPFTKTEDIRKLYIKDLKEHLDYEFKDYCTCDDYYQPVAEDFELEAYLKDWCDDNGFKIVSCEGDGGDGG